MSSILSINQGEGTILTVERTWSNYGDYTDNGVRVFMKDGDVVYSDGDRFDITCEALEGWDLTYFTFEGKQIGFYLTNFTSSSTEIKYKLVYDLNASITSTATPKQYSLSISEDTNSNVVITRLSSKRLDAKIGEITASDPIYHFDELKISFSPDEGYDMSVTINGEDVSSGSTYTVSGNIETISTAVKRDYILILNPGYGVEIAAERTSSPVQGASTGILSDGAILYSEDVLKISFTVDSGSTVVEQLVNQVEFTSGDTFIVDGDVEVTIVTQFEFMIKKSTLDEIGNAVRAQTGKTDLIPVPNLASEILSISTNATIQRAEGSFTTDSYGTATVRCGFQPDLVHIHKNGSYDNTTIGKTCIHSVAVAFAEESRLTSSVITELAMWTPESDVSLYNIIVMRNTNGFSVDIDAFESFYSSYEYSGTFYYTAVKYT